jgi:hypothetical protein
LAIKLPHNVFLDILRRAELTHGPGREVQREPNVRRDVKVQWDPERSPRIGKLEYRSIQIGIRNGEWVQHIVGIEDVTERAQKLKAVVEEDTDKKITLEEFVARDLVPAERPYEVPEDLIEILRMEQPSPVALDPTTST